MDTCGCLPGGDHGQRPRHEFGGPPGWGGWDQINEPREDQWTYHAVSAAILGHSLLRSLPEVDPERVGLTGISWGGYLACIIAGVDPQVGLYASICIALVTAFAGGRPGLISAATGAMALLMITLVREHGLQYLLAATLLTGLLQIVAGFLRLGDALKYVSRSVMTGFVNALAILIFMAQLPELRGVGGTTYAMVAAGLAIIYLLPRVTKAVPSPLVCIVVLTVIAVYTGMDLRTVGDMGQLPSTLPVFLWPQVPLNLETLLIILPYAIGLSVVGLLESVMTASIVDDLTDTDSNKNRECVGQGCGNIVAGLFGGMEDLPGRFHEELYFPG
jgi:SulP family sulfate permease